MQVFTNQCFIIPPLKGVINVNLSHLKMHYDAYSPLIFFPLSWSQCLLLFQVFYDSILFHNHLQDDTEPKIKYENFSQYFTILLGEPGHFLS